MELRYPIACLMGYEMLTLTNGSSINNDIVRIEKHLDSYARVLTGNACLRGSDHITKHLLENDVLDKEKIISASRKKCISNPISVSVDTPALVSVCHHQSARFISSLHSTTIG